VSVYLRHTVTQGYRLTKAPEKSPDTPIIAPSNGQADPVAFDLPSEEPLVTDGTDVWGSPKLLPDGQENPNYGKMPQYKNPTLP
jgi:hypothetical protein